MLLFVSRPARAPETAAAQGRAAPKRPRRKLAKKSSTFLDKSSLKRRNLRGKAIPWVEAFRFETREDYEDSAVYKDKISNMKTRDKGGRPYKVYYCTYARKTGYSPWRRSVSAPKRLFLAPKRSRRFFTFLHQNYFFFAPTWFFSCTKTIFFCTK